MVNRVAMHEQFFNFFIWSLTFYKGAFSVLKILKRQIYRVSFIRAMNRCTIF